MKFAKKIYSSDTCKGREEKLILKLKENKLSISLFLIVIPEGKNNQLEIINSLYLENSFIKDKNFVIIGLSRSKFEAMNLIKDITCMVYKKTSSYNIRNYLEREEEGFVYNTNPS